jgi:hypothetical protein
MQQAYEMNQHRLREMQSEVIMKVFKRTKIMPILKLENGPYTSEEWHCIIEHSTVSMFGDGLTLQIEHLSPNRLRESLIEGLEKVECQDLRIQIWKLICKVQNSQNVYSEGVFSKLLLEEDRQVDRKIEKDLYRTLPGNEEFMLPPSSGKNRLWNVLKAFSAYDPRTGYCQGMNFVVSLLLRHMQDEEEVFWMLVHLMCEKNMRDLYANRSEKLA